MNKQHIFFIFVLLLCNNCTLFGAKINQNGDAPPTKKEINDFFKNIEQGETLRKPTKNLNILNAKKDFIKNNPNRNENGPMEFITKDTPVITYAIRNGKLFKAQKLVEWGADLKIRDGDGKLPQDYLKEEIKQKKHAYTQPIALLHTYGNTGSSNDAAEEKIKDSKDLWNYIGKKIGRSQTALDLELGDSTFGLEGACKEPYKCPLTGNNLLHEAVLGGNEKNIKTIIANNPDLIEQTNNDGQKPIALTKRSVIQGLLKNKQPQKPDDNGNKNPSNPNNNNPDNGGKNQYQVSAASSPYIITAAGACIAIVVGGCAYWYYKIHRKSAAEEKNDHRENHKRQKKLIAKSILQQK